MCPREVVVGCNRSLEYAIFSGKSGQVRGSRPYWTNQRLSEVFCDVLATIVCGPAHYASFVDLALRIPESPFDVSSGAHPALAVRVRACFGALLLQQESVVLSCRARPLRHTKEAE